METVPISELNRPPVQARSTGKPALMEKGIARALWIVPPLLLGLSVHQAKVSRDLKSTWVLGQPAMAQVLAFESRDRADVTYGYLDLQVELVSGEVLRRERLSLPQVFWHRVRGQDSLEVRVMVDAPQPVVIARLMPAHWLVAAAQSGACLMGALLVLAAAWAWNKALRPSVGQREDRVSGHPPGWLQLLRRKRRR